MVNKQTYRAATLRIDLKYLPGQCSDEKFSVVNFVHFSAKKLPIEWTTNAYGAAAWRID